MISKRTSIILSLWLVAASSWYPAYAQSPQETLSQYVSELQKNPNDTALREKIIKHVQTMKPAPEIPEEARKYLVRGRVAIKSAADADGFKRAAQEFSEAMKLAPWLAEGYYNIAVVQDRAGEYDQAINNLKLYLSAAPNATDSKKVQDLIYEIEFRKEEAKRTEAKQQLERQKKYAMTQGLQGTWTNPDTKRVYNATVKDDQFEAKGSSSGYTFTGKIVGTTIEGLVQVPANYAAATLCTEPSSSEPWTGDISSDARQITIKYRSPKYNHAWLSRAGVPVQCTAVTTSGYNWESMKLVR